MSKPEPMFQPAPVAGTGEAFSGALKVLTNQSAGAEYRLIELSAPRALLDRCRPGQFFHLLCPTIGDDTPYLRRPMSIYGFFPDAGILQFLYKVVGAGTRALAGLGAGDRLDVLGPLGHGFTIADDCRHVVLVARGVGLATLAPLALEARRLGRKTTAILSARGPDQLVSVERFADCGAEVITLTDSDGTSDPAHLAEIVEGLVASEGAAALYTCGSKRILRTLQDIARRRGIPGEVALEQQMACGLGMCHCCVRPFRRDGKTVQLRVCREGPVFDLMEAVA